MNVPKRRFKGFTDAWEQRKYADVIELISGQDFEPSGYNDSGEGTPYMTGASCIENGGTIANRWTLTPKCIAKKDDTLLVCKGSGCGALARLTQDEAHIARQFMALRVTETLDNKFNYYLAATLVPEIQKDARGLIVGIARDAILNQKVSIPKSKDEQKKIGEHLSNLDNLIALCQRRYSKLQNLKKAYLSEMFPLPGEKVPRRRFQGFTGDWEQRKLGDMVSFSKGTGYSKSDLQDEGTPIILYGRLYTKYETVISEVDTFAGEKPNSVFSKGREVIVPASGETAEDISVASVVEKEGVLLGGDLNIIMPPADLDSAFLALSISNGKPHNDMAKMAQGKSVVHLHNSDLAKIDLPYPSYEEQCKISSHFANIDTLITLTQRKLEKLQSLKKAYLSEMFPQ